MRLLLRFACLLALCLSACQGEAPSLAATRPASSPTVGEAPTTTATQRPVRHISIEPGALQGTSVRVWHAFYGPAATLFAGQAARFNAENEWGLTVLPVAWVDYTTLFDETNAGIETGAPPDLVVALPEQALAWASAGAAVDLEPYVADDRYGLSEDEIADIPAVFWSQDEVNGKRWGVPALRSARYLFYNATWGYELGFESPPRNAAEFSAQACAANASFRSDANLQNDGYGGWIVDADWQAVYPWLLAFDGGALFAGNYLFDQDANLAALQFLKSIYDENCAWVPVELSGHDAFARRLALFLGADLSEVPAVDQALALRGNHDLWTLIPFPGPGGSAAAAYGPSYTVLAAGEEERLAAWLFARWMLSPLNQAAWVEATGLLPLRRGSLGLLEDYRLAHPQWNAALEAMPRLQGTPQLASWRVIRYVLEDGTQSVFRLDVPSAEIAEVLAEMDATAEELAEGE